MIIKAPGRTRLRVLYDETAERLMWDRVRGRITRERLSRGAKSRPPAVSPTAVLQTREESDDATSICRGLHLPMHPDRVKNWDTLGALSLILEHLDTQHAREASVAVLEAGAALYSSFLPALALYRVPQLIGMGLEHKGTIRRGPVHFLSGDITETGLADGQFDAIGCLSVIEHGVPVEAFFRESARILRPGGLLVVSTDYDQDPPDTTGLTAYGEPVHIFSPTEILQLVEQAERAGLRLEGRLTFDHPSRPVHWYWTGLDYTFIRLTFRRKGRISAN